MEFPCHRQRQRTLAGKDLGNPAPGAYHRDQVFLFEIHLFHPETDRLRRTRVFNREFLFLVVIDQQAEQFDLLALGGCIRRIEHEEFLKAFHCLRMFFGSFEQLVHCGLVVFFQSSFHLSYSAWVPIRSISTRLAV